MNDSSASKVRYCLDYRGSSAGKGFFFFLSATMFIGANQHLIQWSLASFPGWSVKLATLSMYLRCLECRELYLYAPCMRSVCGALGQGFLPFLYRAVIAQSV
jgi:hypothetical protein